VSTLTFDEATHTYRVDGRIVLSVTQILKVVFPDVYAGIPLEILDRKARLGTAVHKVIELYLRGCLDWNSIHPEVQPYFDSWLEWWLDFASPGRFLVEQKFHCQSGDYCGSIDFETPEDSRDFEPGVTDWKITTTKLPVHALQVTGYAHAKGHKRGGCLYLKPDGSRAEYVPYDVVKLLPDWLATLRVYNLKRSFA
jgi:hypothetical protein